MIVRLFAILVLLLVASTPARAAALNIDLAEKSIDITTGFDGARIIVYGTKAGPGEIAVIIRGPDQSVVVRRKARVLGIWMNNQSMVFDQVPGYYDIALSRPARDLAPLAMLQRHNIGLDALEFETDDEDPAQISSFREALVNSQQAKGLFPLEPKPVDFLEDNFFKVSFDLTSNVPAGVYRVEAFLIRDGSVTDTRTAELKVAQNGFSAEIFLFAHHQSLAYSVVVIMMAVFFGWGAYILLRRE